MPSLQFKGRVFVENFHLGVPCHEMTPVRARGLSRKASLHVEGDNLLALKALLPTYHGKVKCICIDPPYNTGNEGWVYNDRVNSPKWFIGRSRMYDVFLIYTDDVEELKNLALTQSIAARLAGGKRPKLVFAPTKYLDQESLHRRRITFQQLPFEIYESVEKLER